MQRLLLDVRGDRPSQDWLFPSATNGPFDYKNFQTRCWRPLVERLAEQGEISFYLTQYHMRHTWITLALRHLKDKDVSYLARVSVNILNAHYSDRSRQISIPEF